MKVFKKHRKIAVIACTIVAAGICGMLARVVTTSAQQFQAPSQAAPHNALLNSLNNLGGYLKLSRPSPAQSVQSALTLGAGATQATASIGGTIPGVLFGGAGLNGATPSLLPGGTPGVYGYAHTGAQSIGVYGYSGSSGGIAVVGSAEHANSTAATLLGTTLIKHDALAGELDPSWSPNGFVNMSLRAAKSFASDGTYLYSVGYTPANANDWYIEKRRLDNGNLCSTGAGCNAAFDPADNDGYIVQVVGLPTGSSALYQIMVTTDSTYMYIVGNDVGNMAGEHKWRIEKRRLDTGALCTAAACGGIQFGTNGVSLVNNDTTSVSVGETGALDAAVDSQYLYIIGNDYDAGSSTAYWRIEKRKKDTGQLCVSAGTCGPTAFGTFGTGYIASVGGVPKRIIIDQNYLYVAGYITTHDWRIEKYRLDNGEICDGDGGCNAVFDGDGVIQAASDTQDALDMETDGQYLYILGSDTTGNRIEKRQMDTGAPVNAFDSDGILNGVTGRYTITLSGDALFVSGESGGANPSGLWKIEKRNATTGVLCDGTPGSCSAAFGSYGGLISVVNTNAEIEESGVFGGYLYLFGPPAFNQTMVRLEKRAIASQVGGTLTVGQTAYTGNVIATSTAYSTPGIFSPKSIRVNSLAPKAAVASATLGYGIYGYSTVERGINMTTYYTGSPLAVQPSFALYGIRAQTGSSIGAYGYALSGNGVEAVIRSTSQEYTIAATSTTSGVDAAAVYATGGAYAGYFDGVVAIINPSGGTNGLRIGNTELSETTLSALITWCGGLCL